MTYVTQSISLRVRGTARRNLLNDVVARLSRGASTRITGLSFSVEAAHSIGELNVRTSEPLGALLDRVRTVEGVTNVVSV